MYKLQIYWRFNKFKNLKFDLKKYHIIYITMSVIYKISCKDENITDNYIGSTIDFNKRKIQHKYSCNNENDKCYNFKVYNFIRDNGGFDNWKIEIIEELETTDKYEMRDIERKYIEDKNNNNATLNDNIPNRSLKEYYNDNKEKILEYQKEYDKNNKDKVKEYKKKYNEQNKDKIKKYYNENKEKLKEKSNQYYDKNKEKKRIYYQNNKDNIRLKQKINCNICNSLILRVNINTHQKSKKCNNIRKKLLNTYFNIWKKYV